MFLAFLKGVYLGLGLVMPLGPLNIFILNNSSQQTRFIAILPVILVASVCDLGLILCAVSGVNVVETIPFFKEIIMCTGVCFLTVMGVKMWKAPARALVSEATRV